MSGRERGKETEGDRAAVYVREREGDKETVSGRERGKETEGDREEKRQRETEQQCM